MNVLRIGTSYDFTNQKLVKALLKLEKKFHLTEREKELLATISLHGYNNKELASVLHIAEKTVKNHLANIMQKTRTNSTRELLALMLRASLEK